MIRGYWILLAAMLFVSSLAFGGEYDLMSEDEQLRQQLAAERALNEQLRRRVEELERQLNINGKNDKTSLFVWDAEPEMIRMPETMDIRSAIDEALIVRGLVLLPTGAYQLTPSISWVHDGSGENRRDSYIFETQLQAGLPLSFAAAVTIPYVKRDYAIGSKDGIGDVSIGLLRKLSSETDILPSLVANLGYTHDTGSHAFRSVPVSSGFRSIEAGIAAFKRFDPMVVSGSIAYDHSFKARGISIKNNGDELFSGDIKRGDGLTLGLGLSLAATPDISVDTGLTMVFQEGTRFHPDDGMTFRGSSSKAGYFNFGFGAILSKNIYLLFSAAAGITDDAIDSIFSVLIPYRF
jgi:hypothetical protein